MYVIKLKMHMLELINNFFWLPMRENCKEFSEEYLVEKKGRTQ